MLYLLVALILFAPAACPVVSSRPSVGTDCAVAARSAGDTAQRSGRRQGMRGRWVRAGGRGGSGGALTVAHISPD